MTAAATLLARLRAAAADLLQVAVLAVPVDRARRQEGPRDLIARLRQRGRRFSPRDAARRAALQRAIARVDRLFPGGPNCYRRVLLEIALDGGAAREPISFGLRAGGGPGSGHAFLGSEPPPSSSYDAVFDL